MNGPNETASRTLDRILHRAQGGFYFLIASPHTQAAAVEPYRDGNYAVYDFARQDADGRRLIQLARLFEREPDRTAYILLNFQLALWDTEARDGIGDWNIDAMRRLDFARDEMRKRDKNMLFCVTKEADKQLNLHSMNFYDFIKLFVRMEDVQAGEKSAGKTAIAVDLSEGVDVIVDFTRSEEELLIQAVALGNRADELREQFRYADALHLYEKQLMIREQLLGKEAIVTAETLCSIARTRNAMGDPFSILSALDLYKQVLLIFKKHRDYGENHPETARIYSALGCIYNATGDHLLSLKCHASALAIRTRVLGRENSDTAASYRDFGATYRDTGCFSDALNFFTEAAAIQERTLGKNNLDTALTYRMIGEVYQSMGKYLISIEWFRKALDIQETVLGSEHIDLAETLDIIVAAYSTAGEYSATVKHIQKALMIREKNLGFKHPLTIRTKYDLAKTYDAIGDHETAKQYRQKAEDAQKQ